MVYKFSLCVTLILIIMPILPKIAEAQSSPSPRLTPDQAIEIAANFCKAIGKSVMGNGNAQFPAPELMPDEPSTYWQQRWQVSYEGQADIEVVDATGIVSDYLNRSYAQDLGDNNELAAGNLMTQDQAIHCAEVALQASGQNESIGNPIANLERNNDPANPHKGDVYWNVMWERQSGHIPYKDDFARVTMDAETGVVTGFFLSYSSPPLSDATTSVSQNQAMDIAQTEMTDAGFPNAPLDTGVPLEAVQLTILQPNEYWQTGDETPLPGPSHIAWIFRFVVQTDEEYREVWVDAQTGGVIGGSDWTERDAGQKDILPGKRKNLTVKQANYKKARTVVKSYPKHQVDGHKKARGRYKLASRHGRNNHKPSKH